MKAINEHFEVGQQYYALVSKEVLVVSEVLQPGNVPVRLRRIPYAPVADGSVQK